MTALVQKLLAGSLIAAATMTGIYAVAATAASSMAANFTTEESSRHTRSVEFETAVKRAWAEHKAARAACGGPGRQDRAGGTGPAARRVGAVACHGAGQHAAP